MAVAKIIELSAESSEGFDDAVRQGVAAASRTVQNIKSAWVKDQEVVISQGKVAGYRVDLKVTFVLE